MKKYILLAVSLMSLASCSLDYDPVSDYSDVTEGITEVSADVVFKDKESIDSYMVSIRDAFKNSQEHWYLDNLLEGDTHADNAYGGTTGAEVIPFETNSLDGANSVLTRDWDRHLATVAVANKLICHIDDVSDQVLSPSIKGQYVSEAKILRAMALFDMVRLWGNIPVITTVAGTITSETIEEVYGSYFPTQSTPIDAYQQIEADLLSVLDNQYAPTNDVNDKTKLTKSVARILLAKVYAEKPLRDYAKVIKYVDELTSDGFSLVENYGDLYEMNEANTDAKFRNTSESIYEAHFATGNGNWVSWMFGRNLINWDENFTWAKWITPSRDLINLFLKEGDTQRYTQSIVYYECSWSNYYSSSNYPFMYKLRSSVNSMIKFRYADALLLKAEALIMGDSPNLSAAAVIINQIRNRAGLANLSTSITSSKEAMLQAYMDERRMELCFEGQRWFDLVRLDKMTEVMNAVYAKDSGRLSQKQSFKEINKILPIPQMAIDSNPNLVQNLGY
ncbi:MAG: RagB/SusD family nutrient uptake outer membrane protein [Bacteroidaceae bacterium]